MLPRLLKKAIKPSPNVFNRLTKNQKVTFAWLSTFIATTSVLAFFTTYKKSYADEAKSGFNPKEFQEYKLAKKEKISHNVDRYRFSFSSPNQVAALPVSSFILAKIPAQPEPIVRPYTPIQNNTEGYFDLMIKTYPTGKMTPQLSELQVGQTLQIKGPIQKIPYKLNGLKQIGMVAGGTGITPMLQVIEEVAANSSDKTEIILVYSNTTEEDILLKDKLDDFAAKHKNIKIYYTVSKPNSGWKQEVGHVTDDMLKKYLPPPSDSSMIYVCGPPGMVSTVSGPKNKMEQGELQGILKRLGYTEKQVYKF